MMDWPIFSWQRFWCPRDGFIQLGAEGFLVDPAESWFGNSNSHVKPVELLSEQSCVVVLGEPGSGKSTTLRAERQAIADRLDDSGKELLWIDLHEIGSREELWRRIFEAPKFSAWKHDESELYLFLDSLDECRVQVNTLPFLLLSELQGCPLDRLRIRLACRTADWPAALEQGLIELWGQDGTYVFELAPLRRIDAKGAADALGLDSETFLAEVARVGAAPLAIKPLTLRFLLTLFSRDGRLPARQDELYEKGCRLLCEESEGRRELRLPRVLEASQRLAVAKRAAAMTVFSNKAAVTVGPWQPDANNQDLSAHELGGGLEESFEQSFNVSTGAIEETLNTGLFTSRGGGRLGWAHRTFEEYLAARYLVDHDVPLAQVLSLIASPNDTDRKIVPQLWGTSSWLAALRADVFHELLLRDPGTLLQSDVASATAADRDRLASALLHACEANEWVDRDWGIRRHYSKLDNPALINTLRPYIVDPSKGSEVRRVAIHIAEACAVRDLLTELVELALNPKEVLETRVTAAYAIIKLDDQESRRSLKPLIYEVIPGDFREELKGVGLLAVWPGLISTQELLDVLTPPLRSNFLGAYRTFLYEDPIKHIPDSELKLAIRWVNSRPVSMQHRHPDDIGRLVEAVMQRVWERLDNRVFRREFGVWALNRVRRSHSLFSEDSAGMLMDQGKRRLALQGVVSAIRTAEEARMLSWRSFAAPEDSRWIISQYDSSPASRKFAWLPLLQATLRLDDFAALDDAWNVCQSDRHLQAAFSHFFGGVVLDSDEAKSIKASYYEWNQCEVADAIEQAPPLPIAEFISDQLAKLSDGDLSGWWQVNHLLMFEADGISRTNEINSDLPSLPGWHASSDELREAMILAANQYLCGQIPEPEKWINWDGEITIYRPDFAGFRALRLLQSENPDAFEALPQRVWRNWAVVIVAYPEIGSGTHDGWHQDLVARAYKACPERVMEAVHHRIRVESAREHPSIQRLLGLLSSCWDEKIAADLLTVAQDPSIPHLVLSDIMTVLLERGHDPALQYAASLIPIPLPKRKRDLETAYLCAATLFTHATTAGWCAFWPPLRRNRKFAEKVFERIVWKERDTERAASRLTESQLSDIYLLLSQMYPPASDPEPDGVVSVTYRMAIGQWRDRILTQLKLRASPESCHAIEGLSRALPDQPWLRWVLLDARSLTRQRSWVPLEPAEVLQFVRSPDQRIVESSGDLLSVVLESLARLEHKLQLAASPASNDLWNSLPDGRFRPKEEEELSDYIKRHLDADLRDRGVISNREVVNRPGEKTDIRVEAFRRDADGNPTELVVVIVEVKGCWNNELMTAMEAQLVGRYLRRSESNHGLYVVGRCNCEKWDPDDWRFKKSPRISRSILQERLDLQAGALSTDGKSIRAFVLDTSLR